MHYHCVLAIGVTVSLMTRCYSDFQKRRDIDVFNLMLGLYKINPLNKSQVYKTFTKNLMSASVNNNKLQINFQSNENDPPPPHTLAKFNEIENLIHAQHNESNPTSFEYPAFDVFEEKPENFNTNVIFNDNSSAYDGFLSNENKYYGKD